MIESTRPRIPQDHPIRSVFHNLTERGLQQTNMRDQETIDYITNMLTDFVDVKSGCPVKDETGHQLHGIFQLLKEAGGAPSRDAQRDCYRYVGDLTLFNLGLFPESLTYGHRIVSTSFYAAQARQCYHLAANLDGSRATFVLRKMSDQFDQCVAGLNWVKLYIRDPFYQFTFREFGIT